jgi:hypothetical protein
MIVTKEHDTRWNTPLVNIDLKNLWIEEEPIIKIDRKHIHLFKNKRGRRARKFSHEGQVSFSKKLY